MGWRDLVAVADRAVQGHLGGVTVSYRPEVGAAVDVPAMFDESYLLTRPEHSGVEQVAPALFVRLEDLPVHPDDDEPLITIAGKVYRVRERQPDGQGGMRLLLHLSEPGCVLPEIPSCPPDEP